jgi:imidazole glycerol-phosphate synthase subunit HisH
MKYVTIIDYGMGNILSVKSAFEYIGASVTVCSDPDKLINPEYLILPGVGSFNKAMKNIKLRGFDEFITKEVMVNKTKLLGICLGMQLMGTESNEDGFTKGLGLLPVNIERFSDIKLKVPHIGFNTVIFNDNNGLFSNFEKQMDFYFVHSYKMNLISDINRIAICNYGMKFLAAFQNNNLCGTQFHPEKSQSNGLLLLKNFLTEV